MVGKYVPCQYKRNHTKSTFKLLKVMLCKKYETKLYILLVRLEVETNFIRSGSSNLYCNLFSVLNIANNFACHCISSGCDFQSLCCVYVCMSVLLLITSSHIERYMLCVCMHVSFATNNKLPYREICIPKWVSVYDMIFCTNTSFLRHISFSYGIIFNIWANSMGPSM